MTALLDKIEMTAEYSNAVIAAVLPHISAFAHTLNVHLPEPLRPAAVVWARPYANPGDIGAAVRLNTGDTFWFEHGHVQGFESAQSYYALQDPEKIPRFYGSARLTRKEAVAAARRAIRQLGFTEEDLYADLEPKVTLPPPVEGHVIPRYRLEWTAPNRENFTVADMEIDGETAAVRMVFFISSNLWRKPPKIGVQPKVILGICASYRVDSSEASVLVDKLIPSLSAFGAKLGLPCPTGKEQISSLEIQPGKIPRTVVYFTNGYDFLFERGRIYGFSAPDTFFTWQHDIKWHFFIGEAKINEAESIAVVRNAVKSLDYSACSIGETPPTIIRRPSPGVKHRIPRVQLEWPGSPSNALVRAEVDLSSGLLKSLYVAEPDQ